MDARLWHQQATAPPIALPAPTPVEVFDELPDAEQDACWDVLSSGLATVVLPSVLARRAATRLTRLVERNTLRPPGAKAIGSVSAPFAVGKSTFVKDWAQAAYRDLLGPACADPRPTWNPEPGVTADWIPHVYITLRAASRIRDVLAALLLTMGYPRKGLVRVTTLGWCTHSASTASGCCSSTTPTSSTCPTRTPGTCSTSSSTSTPSSASWAAR